MSACKHAPTLPPPTLPLTRALRYAQQTNAGQLTRSLLLVPRGTVSVKPNLQIIADDVKCTHGAAISDLDDEQLFYFRSRGVDERLARSALVYSFGAEVWAPYYGGTREGGGGRGKGDGTYGLELRYGV